MNLYEQVRHYFQNTRLDVLRNGGSLSVKGIDDLLEEVQEGTLTLLENNGHDEGEPE